MTCSPSASSVVVSAVNAFSRLGRGGDLRYLDARTNRPAIAASSGERDLGEKGEEKRRERENRGLADLRFGRTAEDLGEVC